MASYGEVRECLLRVQRAELGLEIVNLDHRRLHQQRVQSGDEIAYHHLNTHVVQDIVCIAIVDDSPDTSVDDRLKVGSRVQHPVASRGEVAVHLIVCFLPSLFCSDL